MTRQQRAAPTRTREFGSIEAVVVGCSAGGPDALRVLLAALPSNYAPAVIIVAHMSPEGTNLLPELLQRTCQIPVQEAREREPILPRHVYFAPPNYHLLIESNRTFSLSVDARVCFVRPSIDVLFETAAEVYGPNLAGVIMTGANHDGAAGLTAINSAGGYCLVQDPLDAYADAMPKAAIATGAADRILSLDDLASSMRSMGPQAVTSLVRF